MVIKLIFSTKRDRPIIICIILIQINAGNLNEQALIPIKLFFNHHKIVIYDEDTCNIIIVEMISKK